MKIAFLVSCAENKDTEIKMIMDPYGYSFINSLNAEEIRQAGDQIGDITLCFTDSSFAYKFLKLNPFSFKTTNLLFMNALPRISDDAGRKLREVNLHIVTFSDETILESVLKQSEHIEEVEIEFAVNFDNKGEKDAA